MAGAIEHVFVLMLENRAFDHMLGFSKIAGTDADPEKKNAKTQIEGLPAGASNTYNGVPYPAVGPAPCVMPADPGHEFENVLMQLCGPGAAYPAAGAYPAITNSGFVASYVATGGGAAPGEVMKSFGPDQLPVLNALANEFVICDHWHASIPGPTWPNRMFVHAASSNGLDHSPSNQEIVEWEVVGFEFKNGHIFDQLRSKGIPWRIYAGDDFPMVAALKGVHFTDISHYSELAGDLQSAAFPYRYVFIEPSYHVLDDYQNSTSQHPRTDINLGEGLIKETYEAIRSSAVWNTSLLIITWDEHGGFYDHVTPPAAVPPGDTGPYDPYNNFHFTFQQYGPRVPGLVISPLIPKNLIDHRLYDHASVPATLESLFGLSAMTERDRKASSLQRLVTLTVARPDTPPTLPAAAVTPAVGMPLMMLKPPDLSTVQVARPQETVNSGLLPAIVHSAMRQDLQVSPPQQREQILARVKAIHTREEARQYLADVQKKVRARRPTARGQAGPT